MHVPARFGCRRVCLGAVKALAIKPKPATGGILDTPVIARGIVDRTYGQWCRRKQCRPPPFRRDAFGTVSLDYPQRTTTPAEVDGRAVRNFSHDFDRFWWVEHS